MLRGLPGAVTFDVEAPHVVHGGLYFALIFADRWVQILAGNFDTLFLPTAAGGGYQLGAGWATAAFVLMAAAFETFSPAFSFSDVVGDLRVGEGASETGDAAGDDADGGTDPSAKPKRPGKQAVTLETLLAQQKREMIRFWRREMFKLVVAALVFVGAVMAVMGWVYETRGPDVWYPFYVNCAGYVLMLYGLFNKRFTGDAQVGAVNAIILAVIVGVLGGSVLVRTRDEGWLPATATLFGGACYAVAMHVVATKAFRDSASYQAPMRALPASMQTSGQRWVGLRGALKAAALADLSRVTQRLQSDEFAPNAPHPFDLGRGREAVSGCGRVGAGQRRFLAERIAAERRISMGLS